MKFARLIQVSGDKNANKVYEMRELPGGVLQVSYGRIGANLQTVKYRIQKWNSIYANKIKKGYIDVTEDSSFEVVKSYADITDPQVASLISFLEAASSQNFSENYLVDASSLTQSQISKAKDLISQAQVEFDSGNGNYQNVNYLLESLYAVIPRRMRRVSDFLVRDFSNSANVKHAFQLFQKETELLENAQIRQTLSAVSSDETILDKLEVKLEPATSEEIDKIRLLLVQNEHRFYDAYSVTKPLVDKRFENWGHANNIFNFFQGWHGTKTENALAILTNGMLIRPSGVAHTGSMLGDAIYLANDAEKSIGYTSVHGSRWAGGTESLGLLFILEANLGNTLELKGSASSPNSWPPQGYHSVHAKAGWSTGYMRLRMDELTVYSPDQVRFKYLVRIK